MADNAKNSGSGELSKDFAKSADPASVQGKEKYPRPFSLRLSFQERAKLEELAGDMSVGAYIRSQLFNSSTIPKGTRGQYPVKDQEALGKVLSSLGKSRLASNLNQLARASNSGSLPVTPETEKAIITACREIRWIRHALVTALGLRPEKSS